MEDFESQEKGKLETISKLEECFVDCPVILLIQGDFYQEVSYHGCHPPPPLENVCDMISLVINFPRPSPHFPPPNMLALSDTEDNEERIEKDCKMIF